MPESTQQQKDPPKELGQPVMELRNVTYSGKRKNSIPLINASLTLRKGDLVVVRVDRAQSCRDTASLMQGLHHPISGQVLFEGSDWSGEDFDRHFRMRSRIGRVFDDQAWIQNLNVIENVTLASRHHGIGNQTLQEDIERWTTRMEVPPLTTDRPAFVSPLVLQTYQWIRALITRPHLLILERPMKSVGSERLSKLIAAVNDARQAGTAVLWFTSNPGQFTDDLTGDRLDFEFCDGRFSETSGESP